MCIECYIKEMCILKPVIVVSAFINALEGGECSGATHNSITIWTFIECGI